MLFYVSFLLLFRFMYKTIHMRLFTALLVFVLVVGCKQDFSNKLKPGNYRVMMDVQDDQVLPFNLYVKDSNVIYISNGEERIKTDLVTFFNDSIKINFPVYEGYIVGDYIDGNITNAKYIKESLDRIVPVRFMYGSNMRFLDGKEPTVDVSGTWEMTFVEEDGSSYIGKGIFDQREFGLLRGTIRTTTGDYRYLDGITSKNNIMLSTFDGAHAF